MLKCVQIFIRYFRNSGLNQFLTEPLEPITAAEAEQLEEGSEYIIHIICDTENPVSLIKRWNNKMHVEIKYLYRDDVLIGQIALSQLAKLMNTILNNNFIDKFLKKDHICLISM